MNITQLSIALKYNIAQRGKCVTCVMESNILPGQSCLHDADNNNVIPRAYCLGDLQYCQEDNIEDEENEDSEDFEKR